MVPSKRSFLGQVPLVLGPSSWGVGMYPYNFTPGNPCPPGAFRDQNGECRPRVTMGYGVLEYYDVPLGAFPVPWGMGCGPGEVQDENGRCVPDTYHMGQIHNSECTADRWRDQDGSCRPKMTMGQQKQMVRESGALEHYDVPLGAFPVPWGAMCPDGQVRDASGKCVPDTYRMGQASTPQCERTAEGGYRCPDGTYLPPGCSGGQGVVKAQEPAGGFPWLPVAAGAAVVGAGAMLLAGARRRLGATTLETSYPEIASKLSDYAAHITSERAADAFNFQQYSAASRSRQDLVFASKDIAANLAAQNAKWETSHMNADALAAAQAAFDQNQAAIGQAAQDMQTYRDAINTNQSNIQAWLSNATSTISSLPEEMQSDAKAIIDACFQAVAMRGGIPARKLQISRF